MYDDFGLPLVRFVVAAGLTLLGLAVGVLAIRWLYYRLGPSPSPDRVELEELRERLARLEEREHRVGELEERLDFAERLLARRADAPELPRPGRS